MFNDGNLVLAVAALGGAAFTIFGLAVYALTDVVPQEKPRIERRATKKAA